MTELASASLRFTRHTHGQHFKLAHYHFLYKNLSYRNYSLELFGREFGLTHRKVSYKPFLSSLQLTYIQGQIIAN